MGKNWRSSYLSENIIANPIEKDFVRTNDIFSLQTSDIPSTITKELFN